MGYRSHVVLAIDTEKLEEVDLELLKNADRSFTAGNVSYFEWQSIKWYDSYDDIQECDSFLQNLEDEADTLSSLGKYTEPPYQFMRQGEDSDDFEHRGSWNYDYIEHGLHLADPDIKHIHKDKIQAVLDLIPVDKLEIAKQLLG